MDVLWSPHAPGVLRLPSGRLVRGRGLGYPLPAGPTPHFAVHLLHREPPVVAWESVWVQWPDFGLPDNEAGIRDALTQALHRSAAERVELACWGGRGRTGTALACLAIMDGVSAADAVDYVRTHYNANAVETPAQEQFVRDFSSAG